MTALLAALFVAILLAVIAVSLYTIAPQGVLRVGRLGLGAALAVGAVGAVAAKQVAIGIGLGSIALALLKPLFERARAAPSGGGRSEVRTDFLAMALDHDTGEMDGEVLAGRFAGRRLSDLDTEALRLFLDEVGDDEETASLLFAYLERRGCGEAEEAAPPADPEAMDEAEAYRVLGLEPGASVDEIRSAYRRLVKKVHPDLGGSAALAALINAARRRLDPD